MHNEHFIGSFLKGALPLIEIQFQIVTSQRVWGRTRFHYSTLLKLDNHLWRILNLACSYSQKCKYISKYKRHCIDDLNKWILMISFTSIN